VAGIESGGSQHRPSATKLFSLLNTAEINWKKLAQASHLRFKLPRRS
jgi:hypothetical protein